MVDLIAKLSEDMISSQYSSEDLDKIIVANQLTTEFENNPLTKDYTYENVLVQFYKKMFWTAVRDYQDCEDWFIRKYRDELMFD